MSLSAREQRALDSIEDTLAGSDPELASLLAVFARLTAGEQMPVREKAGRGRRPAACRLRPGRHPGHNAKCGHARRQRRRVGWNEAGVLLWFAAAAALIAVMAVFVPGGRAPCPASQTAACASHTAAHTTPHAGLKPGTAGKPGVFRRIRLAPAGSPSEKGRKAI